MPIIKVSKENFKEAIESNELIVLDFWAAWCGPCRMLGSVLEELTETNPEIVFGKINVDEEGELASEFKIRSIPQIYIVKNGKIVKNISGYVTGEVLLKEIKEC